MSDLRLDGVIPKPCAFTSRARDLACTAMAQSVYFFDSVNPCRDQNSLWLDCMDTNSPYFNGQIVPGSSKKTLHIVPPFAQALDLACLLQSMAVKQVGKEKGRENRESRRSLSQHCWESNVRLGSKATCRELHDVKLTARSG